MLAIYAKSSGRAMKQTVMKLTTWGGKRNGAGRKPVGVKAGVWHVTRPGLKPRFPVHVTWRMTGRVWNLRSQRAFRRLQRAFWGSARKVGYRLVHFAVMGNHVHLMVEASDEKQLTSGMRSLGIRIALGLNRMMGTGGRAVSDRYHARIVKTPREVERCVTYLRTNAAKHYQRVGRRDAFTSQVAFMKPRTWLLKRLE